MNTYMFLQDKRFLQQLDSLRIKQQFVKITVLNWKEEPLKQIQGIAISGSVNLDGSSSMRRTATLSLFAEEKDNNLANIDSLFAINKKCFLELGIVNNVPELTKTEKDDYGNSVNTIINYQEIYGNIVWFPLGLFVMFNPSIAHSMQGVTISMQLKDKMCLLNGDLGGQIHSAVEFSNQDEVYDDNTSLSVQKKPTLIYNIIKQLVNHWGNEQFHKIIISEVPLWIKQVVRWMGNETVYVVQSNKNAMIFTTKEEAENWCATYQIDTAFIKDYQPGQDIGFIYTDFIYPGELTCNAGETVTSVLDKIIGIMGNYQYFYDVFGNFIFQQKANYLNMTNTAYWAKENKEAGETYSFEELPVDQYEVDIRLNKPVYSFVNNKYTTAYNNTLNYNNVKNDFVVWGYRNTLDSNTKVPCRFHLAVDKKPSLNEHYVVLFKDDFQIVRGLPCYEDNPPNVGDTIEWLGVQYKVIFSEKRASKDWREQIYYQMLESETLGTDENTEINNPYFQYYAELKEEFPKIFDLSPISEEDNTAIGYKTQFENFPYEINYYLDFIDEDSQLGQYSVNNIGRRAKIVDDNNEGINCVFEPVIPNVVYIDTTLFKTQKELEKFRDMISGMGYIYTQIPSELYSLFSIGGYLNSCFEKIKDLLYQYTHVNNTISITTLPIYYLEPNTRITVEDGPAGIYGDYIIQSISLPLDINSTMNINAYKALQKI